MFKSLKTLFLAGVFSFVFIPVTETNAKTFMAELKTDYTIEEIKQIAQENGMDILPKGNFNTLVKDGKILGAVSISEYWIKIMAVLPNKSTLNKVNQWNDMASGITAILDDENIVGLVYNIDTSNGVTKEHIIEGMRTVDVISTIAERFFAE